MANETVFEMDISSLWCSGSWSSRSRKAIMRLKFVTIRWEQLNFKSLIQYKVLMARHLYIENGSVLTTADKRCLELSAIKIGTAPHQQILKI